MLETSDVEHAPGLASHLKISKLREGPACHCRMKSIGGTQNVLAANRISYTYMHGVLQALQMLAGAYLLNKQGRAGPAVRACPAAAGRR